MMKILHEKKTWNLLDLQYDNRAIYCYYIRIKGFTFVPKHFKNSQELDITQWLWFQFGAAYIAVLRRTIQKKADISDRSGRGYAVELARDRKDRDYIRRMIQARGKASLPRRDRQRRSQTPGVQAPGKGS